jgi:hypothetical protein
LSTTNRAFFDITIGNMKFAFDNGAIVAGNLFSSPIALFVAIADARYRSPFKG